MKYLDKLTNESAQNYTIITDEGDNIKFNLRYRPSIQCWTFDLSWKDIIINGVRLVNSINLLRQWRDAFPFGLAVTSTDILDPQYIDDFTSGRIKVFVLTQAEVLNIESSLFT